MTRQEFSILRENAGQAIADKANLALGLFTESQDIPFQDETPTPTEPSRSSKTTTVSRGTSLAMRAIVLTTLATENLAFFKEKSLITPERLEVAVAAVHDLYRFLWQKKRVFTKATSRNVTFLEGELRRINGELMSLKKVFRQSEDPETRATIEGKINLTNLRIRSLKGLSDENDRILSFFGQLRSGRQKRSSASRTKKRRR